MEKRQIYVVKTNSDLTEGRGYSVDLFYCELKATAERLAKKRGVMGSDANVELVERYMPSKGIVLTPVYIQLPTEEDERKQKEYDKQEALIARLKESGFSEDEINTLKGGSGLAK